VQEEIEMSSIIRLAAKNDAKQIQAIYSPIVSQTATSLELEPPSVSEIRKRITDTIGRLPWLVCDRKGEILGYAYASEHLARAAYQWSVDTSVYVHAELRRSGIGRALYQSLIRVLILQGYYNAYAGIALPNPASEGLHEAVGFQLVGIYRQVGFKMGAWHDVGWWYLALQPKAVPPRPPLDLTSVQKFKEWNTALSAGEELLQA
jgi:L-amino acid N-acyltransferase YncA